MRTAVLCLLLVSALYEPLRNSLWRVLEVGGVGGVGGLCNLGNPGTCSSLAGRTQNYCFIPGIVAGFTSMAILVLSHGQRTEGFQEVAPSVVQKQRDNSFEGGSLQARSFAQQQESQLSRRFLLHSGADGNHYFFNFSQLIWKG